MDNLEKLLYWKVLGRTIREISEQTGIQSSTLRKTIAYLNYLPN